MFTFLDFKLPQKTLKQSRTLIPNYGKSYIRNLYEKLLHLIACILHRLVRKLALTKTLLLFFSYFLFFFLILMLINPDLCQLFFYVLI